MRNSEMNRRDTLKQLAAAGLVSGVSVPWFESITQAAIKRPRGKSCILLWMDGGPSQQHTFDPKTNGEFKPHPTAVPGIQIVEQLPQLASAMVSMKNIARASNILIEVPYKPLVAGRP